MAFPPEAVGSAYYPIGSLGPLACAVGASAYAPLMRRTLALFQDFDVFVVAPQGKPPSPFAAPCSQRGALFVWGRTNRFRENGPSRPSRLLHCETSDWLLVLKRHGLLSKWPNLFRVSCAAAK
jgi:hypothetical protein